MDAVILAVAHTEFRQLSPSVLRKMFGEGQPVLIDVKGILNRGACESNGYRYWRL